MSGFRNCLAKWLNASLAFVYPEWCQLCDNGRATPEQGFVCENCRSAVELVTPPFCDRCGRPYPGQITQEFTCAQCREQTPAYTFARSAAIAKGTLLEAIHRYKYQRALWLEPFLSDLLAGAAASSLSPGGWDMIVPVPLHPSKQRSREFNQAERLSERLTVVTGIPCYRRVLRRRIPTLTQTKLTREERFKNVGGAFELLSGVSVSGLRIVVIDDVFTTGATTNACAEVLVAGGAGAVCVWTVARGN